ncbi:hypothetical protein TNCV_457571 [Trichonephila clavipes]|nr:hypothetical protein TNCV_457571 [Trichonephila clavipes]
MSRDTSVHKTLKVLTCGRLLFQVKFYGKDLIGQLKICGMSSEHHIDDFMRAAELTQEDRRRAQNNRIICWEFGARSQRFVSRLWKSFKTTGMCVVDGTVGRVRSTTPAETDISSYQQRNRRTSSAGDKSVSLLPQESPDLPKNCCQTFEGGGELYARRPVVCVPLTRRTVLPVCNGVVSITIGLNRTGHAYYSQMRE